MKAETNAPPGNNRNGLKNWVLFFLGAILVFINFFVSLTTLPLYVRELGGTEFHAGLQSTLFFFAAILLRIYFGPLADKRGRKLPLLMGAFVFATSPLLFLMSSSLLSLTLARLYQAIGLATFLSSASSLVADMAPPEKTGTYIGVYRLLINVSLLVGPYVALRIIHVSGFNVWFIVSSLIGAASVGLLVAVKTPPLAPCKNIGVLGNMAVVLKNKRVRTVLLGVGLTSVCYGIILTFASVYIETVTDSPGTFFVLFGLAGMAANLMSGYLSDSLGRPAVAWPSLMLMGLGTAALFFLPRLPLIWITSSIIAGIGYSAGLVALISWLIDAAGEKARATALALQESTIDFSIAVSSFLFGLSSAWFGMPLSFAITGLSVSLASLFFFLKGQK